MSRKVEVMQEMANWLGVDASFYADFDFEHRNESVAIKSGALHQLGLKIQPLIPHGLQKRLLPLYMKINSGGRAPDNSNDAEVLAAFKREHAGVGASLKAMFPNFNDEKWG
jgi:hypothetical protein